MQRTVFICLCMCVRVYIAVVLSMKYNIYQEEVTFAYNSLLTYVRVCSIYLNSTFLSALSPLWVFFSSVFSPVYFAVTFCATVPVREGTCSHTARSSIAVVAIGWKLCTQYSECVKQITSVDVFLKFCENIRRSWI